MIRVTDKMACGGRSVSRVRLRTKATEFSLFSLTDEMKWMRKEAAMLSQFYSK
jgi:hypothetical protein